MHFKISRDFLSHISDLDALPINKKLTYEILDSDVFTIDPDSGIVRLAQELDREIQALYNLTIRATDQGRPRRLSQTSNLVKILNLFSSFFSKKKNVKKSVQKNSFHKKVVYTPCTEVAYFLFEESTLVHTYKFVHVSLYSYFSKRMNFVK